MGAEVGWERQTFRWKLVQGFRSWLRQEDLSLGPNWEMSLGLSLPALGGDRTRVRYHVELDAGRWRERTYMWAIADLSGRIESGEVANGISHLELGGAVRKGRAPPARRGGPRREPDGDRQLTLGADTGLRAFSPPTPSTAPRGWWPMSSGGTSSPGRSCTSRCSV